MLVCLQLECVQSSSGSGETVCGGCEVVLCPGMEADVAGAKGSWDGCQGQGYLVPQSDLKKMESGRKQTKT